MTIPSAKYVIMGFTLLMDNAFHVCHVSLIADIATRKKKKVPLYAKIVN